MKRSQNVGGIIKINAKSYEIYPPNLQEFYELNLSAKSNLTYNRCDNLTFLDEDCELIDIEMGKAIAISAHIPTQPDFHRSFHKLN
jgi:hypothetical protein